MSDQGMGFFLHRSSRQIIAAMALLCCALGIAVRAKAQAAATATASRQAMLEFFGMGSGVWTQYTGGGRNVSLTAGGDLMFHAVRRVSPGFELRFTAPLSKGEVAGEKTYLGGGRLGLNFGRFHPFVDALFGLGRIEFAHPRGTYVHDNSTIYDAGGGLEVELAGPFSLRTEGQWQHWKIGVGAGETFTPAQVSVGLSYRFFPGRMPHGR